MCAYARERDHSLSFHQTDSLNCLKEAINYLSYPVCIHNNNGMFVLHNEYFENELLKNHNTPAEWFSHLPQEISYALSRAELETLSHIEMMTLLDSVNIVGENWSVHFQILSVHRELLCMWHFNKIKHRQNAICLGRFSYKRMESLVMDFRERCGLNHWNVHNLHVSGLSHESISKILSISPGTSRNIISDIHASFNTNLRDELIISTFASGQNITISKNVAQLIKKHVRKLL
ncbi:MULTISPECIES: hypothetical protein [Rahnella]|jgi:hypothetical protein|uniref:Conjugal transfer transcriptional regulator TraJ n=1 Tax=Rahnella ecdela TaxID=2816250 RepID=A0ABS6LE66_9GAMM|nr:MULTISPECIES: hypothetical protein [Rahnella]MBU9844819.1 hypothetical protein [Rahnella ecdela]